MSDKLKGEMFPIMRDMKTVAYIPMGLVLAHEGQALTNHSQTVRHLASRGGLDAGELAAVLEDRAWCFMSNEGAWRVIWSHTRPATLDAEKVKEWVRSRTACYAPMGKGVFDCRPDELLEAINSGNLGVGDI